MEGSQTFAGVHSQRPWVDIWTVENFLVETWPKTVVELGTGTGAFSVYLATYCAFHGYAFHTLDTHQIRHSPFQTENTTCTDIVRRLGGHTLSLDVFAEGTIAWAGEVVAQHKPAFVYCDDGDKPREVAAYAPLLAPGDFLGVHDFGHEILGSDLELDGFEFWKPELFEECGSTNRVLERVS